MPCLPCSCTTLTTPVICNFEIILVEADGRQLGAVTDNFVTLDLEERKMWIWYSLSMSFAFQ